ncbi:MAG: metallophosphoesterase [Clostridia bacterium]|nr:metallophosphoesterase [Clostridia bacterium]
MKKPFFKNEKRLPRALALICCAAIAFSLVSGAFIGVFAEQDYILTELNGFAGYNRIALATVYIHGVKSASAFDGADVAPAATKGVRVTGASAEVDSFSIATCRAPDSSMEDVFAYGAHIDPVASGVNCNAFGSVSPADSDGVRIYLATGSGSAASALKGTVRVRAAMTPSKGASTADLYAGYEQGFVFETEDFTIGEDGYAYVYWKGAECVDGFTADPERFESKYLPRVNALCITVTPADGVAVGQYYYIGGISVFREYHKDLWEAAEDGVYTGERTVHLRTTGGVFPRLSVDGNVIEPVEEFIDTYGDRHAVCSLDTLDYGDGKHTLRMTVGTRLAFEQNAVFDNEAPYFVSSSINDGADVPASASLDLKVADAASGVESLIVKLDGSPVDLPYSLANKAAGVHNVVWTAIDRAGYGACGSFVFTLVKDVFFGDFYVRRDEGTGDGITLFDVDMLNGDGRSVTLTGFTDVLPVSGRGNVAELSALSARSAEGETPLAAAYNTTVSADGRYPYQVYEVDVSGYDKDEFTVSFTGGANSGETLVLSVFDPAGREWVKLTDALVASSTVTLGANVPTAAYADNGSVLFRVSLFTVDNGSDTFAWTTDTQYYIEHDWSNGPRDITFYMEEQFDQIAADYLAGDIGYMVNTGDTANTMNEEQEYVLAQQIYQRIYAVGLPNGILPGNHEVWRPDFKMWQKYFGEKYYSDKAWYGGGLNDNINHYDLITIGGRDFIFMYIGWTDETSAATIEWANRVLATYRSRTAVVCFHGYLTPNAEFLTQYVTAENFWKSYLNDNPNVRLILCGHEPGIARDIRAASDGRNVTEILQCYQMDPVWWYQWRDGGSGIFRYMTVGDGTITSRAYSASREKYEEVLGHNVDNDGGYYYWDFDEENFTMPVDYVETNRVIRGVSFVAYDPASSVELGRAGCDSESCTVWIEGNLLGAKAWQASVRSAKSGVFVLENASSLAEGDMDGDGEVTVTDALSALRAALGLQTPPRQVRLAGDVDGDGDLTVSDALLILRRSAGIV